MQKEILLASLASPAEPREAIAWECYPVAFLWGHVYIAL